MTMLASLVVPVYQERAYLPRTVSSWLHQELDRPFEVLLIDNGSTDGGVATVSDHPRLYRLREPRRGAYAARNTGVGVARGEFIVFTDPDCAAPDGWLQRLLTPLREDANVVAVQGPARPVGEDRRLRLLGLYEFHREVMVYRSGDPRLYYAHTNNLAVRREVFDRCGLFGLRARGADTLLARSIVDAFGCEAMVHAPDASVDHLEVDALGVWMRKTYLYARNRHGQAGRDDVRSLSLRERLSVWRSAARAQNLSPAASAEMLLVLGLGCVCWCTGDVVGLMKGAERRHAHALRQATQRGRQQVQRFVLRK